MGHSRATLTTEGRIVVEYGIKKRDAKTGSKRERVIAKLSMEQVRAGQWTRGAGGSAHHFTPRRVLPVQGRRHRTITR